MNAKQIRDWRDNLQKHPECDPVRVVRGVMFQLLNAAENWLKPIAGCENCMAKQQEQIKALADDLAAKDTEIDRISAEAPAIILIAEKTCDDCFRVCHLRGRSTWIHGKENTGGAAFLARYKAMETVVEAAKGVIKSTRVEGAGILPTLIKLEKVIELKAALAKLAALGGE